MASATETIANSRTRILLASGNPELAQTVRGLLRTANFRRVLNVSTGDDVIRELALGGVEVLLSALQLPDIDAWRLTRMIRSGRFGPCTVPIVVFHEGHSTKILETVASDEGIAIASLDEPGQLIFAINAAMTKRNQPTLLAIEDDKRAAEVLKDGLQNDFDVELAYDGETGVAAWKTRRHQLVVLDFMLPGMSGAEVLQQILATDRLQPVVILTAHASVDRHHDLVFAGATDFLAKPYEMEHLRYTCESVLRHSELMDTCAEFQETEGVMHRFTNRVYAAERCLSVGKTWIAYQNLKSALIECRNHPPSDAEWENIISEVET